ncbi:DUF3237 domain-containing protein [Altererythrobacter sp. Root672]|uniref:DUF3237 domain-containing protein n=1 Tax=Altererythrobacter sp. Root672 TaxID=1736584 RepID=UPI0009E8A377|nr:DUF3237 domain-containing protein [Altererythrobacter sp. Root672]
MKVTLALAGLACGLVAVSASAQEAPTLEFAFEEIVTLGEVTVPGDTAQGGRIIIPITGGTFEGPAIKGTIVPGGWDYQLRRADGCNEVKADYFLKTDDGVVINVVNTGVICMEGGAMKPVRTHPVFEAPRGKYEWLSQVAFVGTLEPAPPSAGSAVKIRFYRVR